MKTGQNRSTYSMAYVMNPLPIMLNDQQLVLLEEDYEKINKVLDIAMIRKWKANPIENWCWGQNPYREDYTKKEFDEMRKAFFHLIKMNPKIYLNARFQQYMAANSRLDRKPFPFLLKAHHEFFKEREAHVLDQKVGFHPINVTYRLIFINNLLLEDSPLGKIFWNFQLQIFAVFAAFAYEIYKRNFRYILMGLGGVFLFLCLFFMTPEANMMYYLPLYYIGNFMLIIFLTSFLKLKKITFKSI